MATVSKIFERQCEDVADFGHAGITEIAERYPMLCPEFFSLINKIGDEYVERIANGDVIYYFGSNLAQKILTAAAAKTWISSLAPAIWKAIFSRMQKARSSA